MLRPGEPERAVREDDIAERENGELRPNERESELLRAGCSKGEEGSATPYSRRLILTGIILSGVEGEAGEQQIKWN